MLRRDIAEGMTVRASDFEVGQRVTVAVTRTDPDTGATETSMKRGRFVAVQAEHPFPAVVRLDAGPVIHALLRNVWTLPESADLDDLEAWLDA